ncbi:hypothetical protein SAMN05428959_1011156 [Duganella sp. CF517]|uniref:hypothetical protein n=1 Tax=Duganella sp. CF517 TaxID=1881038 RepID=UPI0008B68D77|nr:hypothetical protein [Duganella sp. CF517]SEN31895.1 hypothetical protein SAMN05428959_1011156 [Duganella sp. CF517]
MNQRTNVNTVLLDAQAKNITLPLLHLNTLRLHVESIQDQALTAQTMAEMAIEILGGTVIVEEMMARLDALFKSTHRAVIVIEESASAMSLAFEEVEGGEQ